MFLRSGKKNEKPTPDRRACTVCGLALTDPLWRVCPRCRAETNRCGGCRDCGRCAK